MLIPSYVDLAVAFHEKRSEREATTPSTNCPRPANQEKDSELPEGRNKRRLPEEAVFFERARKNNHWKT